MVKFKNSGLKIVLLLLVIQMVGYGQNDKVSIYSNHLCLAYEVIVNDDKILIINEFNGITKKVYTGESFYKSFIDYFENHKFESKENVIDLTYIDNLSDIPNSFSVSDSLIYIGKSGAVFYLTNDYIEKDKALQLLLSKLQEENPTESFRIRSKCIKTDQEDLLVNDVWIEDSKLVINVSNKTDKEISLYSDPSGKISFKNGVTKLSSYSDSGIFIENLKTNQIIPFGNIKHLRQHYSVIPLKDERDLFTYITNENYTFFQGELRLVIIEESTPNKRIFYNSNPFFLKIKKNK